MSISICRTSYLVIWQDSLSWIAFGDMPASSASCLYWTLPSAYLVKPVLNKSPLTPYASLYSHHNKTSWNNFVFLQDHLLVTQSFTNALQLSLCSHCSTEITIVRVSKFTKSSCHLSVLTLPDLSRMTAFSFLKYFLQFAFMTPYWFSFFFFCCSLSVSLASS